MANRYGRSDKGQGAMAADRGQLELAPVVWTAPRLAGRTNAAPPVVIDAEPRKDRRPTHRRLADVEIGGHHHRETRDHEGDAFAFVGHGSILSPQNIGSERQT
jgi:hypothetical protein